jgi:hypothetical protein
MTSFRLRLTGPEGRPYVLGEPIEVYDGATLIGHVHSVTVSADGMEVLAENFLTVDFAEFRSAGLPKLVLAEVVAFITEGFPVIHTIGVELSRDIEGYEGREALLAGARTEILHSIGAQDVRVTPKPVARHAGHFAVTGVWHYDRQSLDALAATLEAQRAAYQAGKRPPEPPPRPARGFGRGFRK